MGMRAQESPARSKLAVFRRDDRASSSRKQVDVWLPVHHWTVEQVWARIRASGVEHHPAYDLGMPRLSCCFCIYSPKAGLLLAGKHNPELLRQYVAVEREIRHTFRQDLAIEDILRELEAGVEIGSVSDWRM